MGRQGAAFDARVESDLRLAATAQEAYYGIELTYGSDCTALPGFIPSPGIVFPQCTGDSVGFVIETDHPSSTQTCLWVSTAQPPLTCTDK